MTVVAIRNQAPTVADLEERIRATDETIRAKGAELEDARSVARAAVLSALPRDFATLRDQGRVESLEGQVRNLRSARVTLAVALEAARQRDRDAAWRAEVAKAREAGEALERAASESQALFAKLAASLMATRSAALAFADRAEACGGFREVSRLTFPAQIVPISGLALFAISDGALRPTGLVVESPFQVRESGRGDLAKAAREWSFVALKGARPETEHAPPPVAA